MIAGFDAELVARWRANAACKGLSDLFLPDAGETQVAQVSREARAKAVCRTCPSLIPCRDWAREHREPFVAGGESAYDRKQVGVKPLANGAHVVDPQRARRLQAERELAAIYTRDVPLEDLEQIAALARALTPTKETRE